MTRKTALFFSYFFHPIGTPTLAVLLYFKESYVFFKPLEIGLTIGQVFLTTFLIPITCYYLLRSLGFLKSTVMIHSWKERMTPFLIQIGLLFLLQHYVLQINSVYEFNVFLEGLMYSYILLSVGLLFKVKFSVHTASLSALCSFFLLYSIRFFEANLFENVVLILLLGLTATARLKLNAHKNHEIFIGFLIGILPQIVLGL